jgi:glutamate 5-kinase
MNLPRRPKHLPKVQALAAIGQCKLLALWDQLFGNLGQTIAQVLLTRNDIADRTQYQNAQNTFIELLSMGVIPIVNENDTLAVTEIKFGDNDTLSAITAGMVQADYLFLMTDVDCLYDKNPRSNPDAQAIEVVEDITQLTADVNSAGSALGTGGMSTKIVAARLATSAGVTTVITKSSKPGNISAIIAHAEQARKAEAASNRNSMSHGDQHDLSTSTSSLPEPQAPSTTSTTTPSPQTSSTPVPLHTRFLPISHPIRDRYFWILHGLAPHGTIYIDTGAYKALHDKAGLLPVGIVDVEGHFAQQEAVRLVVVKRLAPSSSTTTTTTTTSSTSTSSTAAVDTPSTPATPTHTTHTHAPIPLRHPLPHSTSSTSSHTPTAGTPSSSGGASLFEQHNPAPVEIGRAVVNYSAAEIRRIKGMHSTQIVRELGYADSEYVAVRENVAFFGVERSRPATPALE